MTENKRQKHDKTIHILALSWRDCRSPKSGGAEVHTHSMLKTAGPDFAITHFAPLYPGLPKEEIIDGITYRRAGNWVTVIFHAWRYFRKHRNEIDFVIDQCNTHRFFTGLWVPKEKRIFYIHQLTREIWDINFRFPLNLIGRWSENWMLRLQKNDPTITVSQSTKDDLVAVGFDPEKIVIIPNGVDERFLGMPIEPEKHSADFIYAGRYSRYKGIDAAVLALGILRKTHPQAKLHIIGRRDDTFVQEVLQPISEKLSFRIGEDDGDDVVLHGFVSEEEKFSLMRRAQALLFPSIREGWGIIVSEAGAMGTPSIVYDAPGSRDAVDRGRAGYLCAENSPEELARLMKNAMEDEEEYSRIRQAAYDFAQNLSWEHNSRLFPDFIESLKEKNDGR